MGADLDQLLDLLAAGAGVEDPEEDVPGLSITHHGRQCATILRRDAPDDIELQVAGLLHDIGHVVAPGRPAEHAATGAAVVRPVLGTRAAGVIGLHVAAKRYLVATEPYGDGLSVGSQWSLERQGGPMSPEEVAEFRSRPLWRDAVALRRADEESKDPDARVDEVDAWLPDLTALAAQAASADRAREGAEAGAVATPSATGPAPAAEGRTDRR